MWRLAMRVGIVRGKIARNASVTASEYYRAGVDSYARLVKQGALVNFSIIVAGSSRRRRIRAQAAAKSAIVV